MELRPVNRVYDDTHFAVFERVAKGSSSRRNQCNRFRTPNRQNRFQPPLGSRRNVVEVKLSRGKGEAPTPPDRMTVDQRSPVGTSILSPGAALGP
jgi:hypothetical protein